MVKRHLRQAGRAGAVLLLCTIATLPALAADNVHFSGNLVSGACTLTVQGGNVATVDFAQIDSAEFIPAGQSARKPLLLELTDCDSALSNSVKVTLAGTEASGADGILAINSDSKASGIGIGIETQAGISVDINSPNGATFTLKTGNNTLRLNTWVQRLSGEELVPGAFNATATVTFEYL